MGNIYKHVYQNFYDRKNSTYNYNWVENNIKNNFYLWYTEVKFIFSSI